MSFSISISGHINDGTPEDAPTAAQTEAQLAVKLHDLLSDPVYGVTYAYLSGMNGGGDLLAARRRARRRTGHRRGLTRPPPAARCGRGPYPFGETWTTAPQRRSTC
jgi:hypothetical protein